ncbi:recombinase family protein [Neisseria meningitidis]|uniref:recombinase family protein n=1 Tax=Neisseria meningitidis TaxID=487 RepID=UPI001C5A9AD9|nr:recombinase family protein [Neisseria meningitidis]MBW3892941.1 recombinase family protein [Neisseria meningitidis]
MSSLKIARIYLRVSTLQQNLERQRKIIDEAKENGFYIAGIYEEKASGVNASRPELNRLIDDLQEGDWVIAERIDRITRLPPREAELLIQRITEKGAKLHVPDVFSFGNLDELMGEGDSLPKYLTEPLMEALQKMFLRMALSIAHEDWKTRRERANQGIARAKREGRMKGRPANEELHKSIIQLTLNGVSITGIASALKCSPSTVSKVRRGRIRI